MTVDFENVQRIVGLQGTKADVEALSGSLKEVVLAFTTDTGEIGVFDGSIWRWAGAQEPVGKYRQFVYVVSGGDFSFVIDVDGEPVMALEDLE